VRAETVTGKDVVGMVFVLMEKLPNLPESEYNRVIEVIE